MTIRMLDDALINKIAAGEVIERPASVVKELVENAMDAGSQHIRITISRGGHDLIEIADDGRGIPEDEIPLAFMRHATSKLVNEQDLFAISTLGFRGEALPSIAAVSRVEIRTACQDGYGQHVLIEGGRRLNSQAAPFPRGTTIQVRDLFFNTPARRKFMKSAGSESGKITQLVSGLSLARPDIAIEYRNEKRLFFKTPGDGSLYKAMLAIYGNDYCSNFLPIDYESEGLLLEGYVSRPDFRRLNRRSQMFFVNERLIESPMLSKALDEGYRGRLISREYPAAVIKLTVPPFEIDVNIHPQKREIKFQDDSRIFRALQSVVKAGLQNSLEGIHGSGSTHFSPEYVAGNGLLKEGENTAVAGYHAGKQELLPLERNWHYRSFNQAGRQISDSAGATIDPAAWRLEVARQQDRYIPRDRQPAAAMATGNEVITDLKLICQLHRRYIVLEDGNGLLLIDQHAAHERIVFERLRSNSAGAMEGQTLLMPLCYELGPAGYDFVMDNTERFLALGLEIEAFGENSVLVRSLPAQVQGLDLGTLDEIIEILQNQREDELRDRILALLACKNSIKSGEPLDPEAMQRLVAELFSMEDPYTCPHGRPTIIKIDASELDRRFKRTV